jgi:phosphoribosyl 1,2-cyclic phosphodiesterase
VIVLDAGTGIRRLGGSLPPDTSRVDLLLTHLHMDHIQGLGFFGALYNPSMDVHVWGPASATLSLRERLSRYMSPPLFPVLLRDLPCRLTLHEMPASSPAEIGEFTVSSQLVCHPGPTVGYRLETETGTLCYICDHEPALGLERFPGDADWTSGFDLARDVDLLIHDGQYTIDEYPGREGWGHSTIQDAIAFADQAGARALYLFHHDPAHDDDFLDVVIAEAIAEVVPGFPVVGAKEGHSVHVSPGKVVAERVR